MVNLVVGLGSHWAHELALLLDGLESAVTVLGGGVDELEVEGLEVRTLGDRHHTLAKSHGALSGATHATLEHHEILVDLAVVRETTHRGDALLGEISLSGTGHGVSLLADTEHTLVDLGTVVVTLLTSTSNSGFNTSRMPSTNARHLAETSVGLSWQAGNTPTTHDTSESVTASGTAHIQHLALAEHLGDVHRLLEQTSGKVNLGTSITTVDLDLHQVGHLLSELQQLDLGVSKDTNYRAVLLDAVDLSLNLLGLLSGLLGVLGEGFLLGVVPVLVEATLEVIGQVVGPNSGQSAKTVWCGNITNNTNHNHRRCLQHGDSLHSFLLVKLGSWSLDFSDNVTHASLASHESGQVRSQGGVILGEGSNAPSVAFRSLLGQVLQ